MVGWQSVCLFLGPWDFLGPLEAPPPPYDLMQPKAALENCSAALSPRKGCRLTGDTVCASQCNGNKWKAAQ